MLKSSSSRAAPKHPAPLPLESQAIESRVAGLIARRRPGWSLEQPFYTDPAIFSLDLERVFRGNWLFAGHANRIPRPGDYFTHEGPRELEADGGELPGVLPCPVGHPEYCRIVMPTGQSREEVAAFRASQFEKWARAGLSLLDVRFAPDNGFHCARYPMRPGFVSESLDGQPVAPLLGRLTDRDAGILAIVLFPNFWLEASSDYICTMRRTPISPTLCEVEATWLVHENAVEGRDYDVERVTAFWRATGEQDWTLCENNQASVNGTRYQPGPYALVESGPETFVQWYLRQLAAPNGGRP